jgi:trehalose 6-phosphate synthase/phosphatase
MTRLGAMESLAFDLNGPGHLARRPPRRTTPATRVEPELLPRRFVVASNRLPYRIEVENQHVRVERGMGGLVTAMDPVLQLTGGLWLGWSGSHAPVPAGIEIERPRKQGDKQGNESGSYELRPLELSEEDVSRFYLGYCNRAIWPLFHYFQEHCRYDEADWAAYVRVNRSFADRIVADYRAGDFIWIHDYHLMLVPALVRERIPDASIGFFLHIPFPAPELFQIDPHAPEILEGLLGADLLGFHVPSYARNFVRTVAEMKRVPCSVEEGWVLCGERKVRTGSFPISIDVERFAAMARRDGIEDEVRAIREDYRASVIAIGVDRLDYTKGILERLKAIEIMLERHPDMRGQFTFIQISAPSRTKVEAYREQRRQIEQMVGRINGRFGVRGCLPVDYRYEGHPQEELVAYYRAADLALVTPLRDGMNLVAKEYVASRVDGDGCLVLSPFAGAHRELRDAVVVNPYHPQDMAEGIYRAACLPVLERRRAMQRMREVVERNDIYRWLEKTLRAQREALADRC